MPMSFCASLVGAADFGFDTSGVHLHCIPLVTGPVRQLPSGVFCRWRPLESNCRPASNRIGDLDQLMGNFCWNLRQGQSAANFISLPLGPQGREWAADITGANADLDRRAAECGGSGDD